MFRAARMGRPLRKSPEPRQGIPDSLDMGKVPRGFKSFPRHGRRKEGRG